VPLNGDRGESRRERVWVKEQHKTEAITTSIHHIKDGEEKGSCSRRIRVGETARCSGREEEKCSGKDHMLYSSKCDNTPRR